MHEEKCVMCISKGTELVFAALEKTSPESNSSAAVLRMNKKHSGQVESWSILGGEKRVHEDWGTTVHGMLEEIRHIPNELDKKSRGNFQARWKHR